MRLGGGVATIEQYLREGLVDDLHVVIAPRLRGSGERLFGGVGDVFAAGYECVEFAPVAIIVRRARPAAARSMPSPVFDTMEA